MPQITYKLQPLKPNFDLDKLKHQQSNSRVYGAMSIYFCYYTLVFFCVWLFLIFKPSPIIAFQDRVMHLWRSFLKWPSKVHQIKMAITLDSWRGNLKMPNCSKNNSQKCLTPAYTTQCNCSCHENSSFKKHIWTVNNAVKYFEVISYQLYFSATRLQRKIVC